MAHVASVLSKLQNSASPISDSVPRRDSTTSFDRHRQRASRARRAGRRRELHRHDLCDGQGRRRGRRPDETRKRPENHDLSAVLLARNRISYWFGADINNSGDREASRALLLVELELNRLEHWLVKGLSHRRSDAKDRREWLGLLLPHGFEYTEAEYASSKLPSGVEKKQNLVSVKNGRSNNGQRCTKRV